MVYQLIDVVTANWRRNKPSPSLRCVHVQGCPETRCSPLHPSCSIVVFIKSLVSYLLLRISVDDSQSQNTWLVFRYKMSTLFCCLLVLHGEPVCNMHYNVQPFPYTTIHTYTTTSIDVYIFHLYYLQPTA